MVILITQLTILGINEVHGAVRIATVVIGCVMLVYNIPHCFVIGVN
jgi:MFS-type transporter involved in bile tolerance (Atg22 family)